MKCPYCSKEMEKGLIQSPQELAWLEGEKKHMISRASVYEGSVILSKFSYFKGSAVTAFLCRNCKKVLVDYADPASDFNNRKKN